MISNGFLSVGNSIGFSSGKSLGNSATGSYITRIDNGFVTIGPGPILLEVSIFS